MRPLKLAIPLVLVVALTAFLIRNPPAATTQVETASTEAFSSGSVHRMVAQEAAEQRNRDTAVAKYLAEVHAAEQARLTAARTEALRASRAKAAARAAKPATPRPTVAPQAHVSYSAGSIQDMICQSFGASCSKALRVAKCESGYNPRATNGQYRGLFQIGVRTHAARIAAHHDSDGRAWTADDMYDPAKNIVIALELSNGGRNWGPWECQ